MAQGASSDDFRSSPIWHDVQETILSGPRDIGFGVQVRIHTEKGDFNVLKVLETQESCDYAREFCPSIFMRLYIGMGDYVFKLLPFRDMLEVSVKKTKKGENSEEDPEAAVDSRRYRAVMPSDKNMSVTGSRMANMDYNTLQNSNDLVEVCLELLERNVEVMRVATVPGLVYKDVTPKQLISGLMMGQSQKWKVDGKSAVEAIDLVEPDNSRPMKSALIEANTKIANIPTYIQEKLSGVYATGVGTFLDRFKDKSSWFVYPLYSTKRFDKGGERAVIFSVPEDIMSGLERSYRKAGQVLYIAATGGQSYTDDSQVSDLNAGVGFRQVDARAMITKPVTLTTEGPIADRARLNREVGNRQRSDGVYYAPTVKPSINPFKNYSRVAANQISEVRLTWENSNGDLITPGMPCKYVFMDGGEYREVKGTILAKYTVSALAGSPGTAVTYRTFTMLTLALEYYSGSPEQPTEKSPGSYE